MVEELHRSAQGQLGLMGALLSSDLWVGVDPTQPSQTTAWAALMAQNVIELRALSAGLGKTVYQLARWIETGVSFGESLSGARSGEELFSYFLDLVESVAVMREGGSELGGFISVAERRGRARVALALDSLRDAVVEARSWVLPGHGWAVDSFRWPELAEDVDVDIIRDLRGNALKTFSKHVARARSLYEGEEFEGALGEITRAAGAKGAGRADKLVLDAGRDVALYAAEREKRFLMYARGTSLNPCAFCAMLASRGFVYNTTSSSRINGSVLAEVRSYHSNCHCYPIFRWRRESQLPERARFFAERWPEVTAGYSGGKDKINAWRRWLNSHKLRNGGVVNFDDSQEE